LRHLAQANDCIIIDEPELNLHPDNQILVARFLGRLVNEGFKVIVSTHSDYIIKEINNLVMLSKINEATTALLNKYGYSSKQTIRPEQIEALLFRLPPNGGGIVPEKIQVTATGLGISTIDEVIDKLENRAEDIYYQLFEN
jgi:predicted ATPase